MNIVLCSTPHLHKFDVIYASCRTYSLQQQALVLLSVSIDNIINIDVGVVINDYYHHLREEGGEVLIKEFHDSL